jgi:hypothetical protein
MALSRIRSLVASRTTMDLHDDWNMVALGALNAAHVGWWVGLLTSTAALHVLFFADAAYLLADSCWLLFVPSCVAPRNRATLLVHHLLICGLLPLAAGKPVFMRHLLRTWIVEVHSWNHIAARRLSSQRARTACDRVNKPLFVALRLVAFPLTWVQYAAERGGIVPLAVHVPLSCAHALMYGLMLKWGRGILLPPAKA